MEQTAPIPEGAHKVLCVKFQREMEGLEAQIKGGKNEEAQLREETRRLLTNGWLAPAAGKLNGALRRVVAKNDAAQAQAKAIQTAQDRVQVPWLPPWLVASATAMSATVIISHSSIAACCKPRRWYGRGA